MIKQTAAFNIRITPENREAVKRIAKSQGRSMNNLFNFWLQENIDKAEKAEESV